MTFGIPAHGAVSPRHPSSIAGSLRPRGRWPIIALRPVFAPATAGRAAFFRGNGAMPSQPRQLDTLIEIVTPENISFQYRVAGPFRRLVAYGVDLVVRLMILVVLSCVMGIVLSFAGLPGLSLGVALILYFVLDWFYGGLCEALFNGKTPGKHLLHLRVVSTTGQPIRGWQALLRNILRVADALPIVFLVPTFQLGLLVMFVNPRFQRLGDLVCGTMVVIEERQPLYGVARVADVEAIRLAGELTANFVAERGLARALSAYVQRRQTLGWGRRAEIARHLGEPLRARFGLPIGTSHDLLLCALYHKVFIADRVQEGGGSPFARSIPRAQSTLTVPTGLSQRREAAVVEPVASGGPS